MTKKILWRNRSLSSEQGWEGRTKEGEVPFFLGVYIFRETGYRETLMGGRRKGLGRGGRRPLSSGVPDNEIFVTSVLVPYTVFLFLLFIFMENL